MKKLIYKRHEKRVSLQFEFSLSFLSLVFSQMLKYSLYKKMVYIGTVLVFSFSTWNSEKMLNNNHKNGFFGKCFYMYLFKSKFLVNDDSPVIQENGSLQCRSHMPFNLEFWEYDDPQNLIEHTFLWVCVFMCLD